MTFSTLWACAFAHAETPPNIIIILTDDQGYADISLNPAHPPEVFTPHMDALAREGVQFTQAYTSGNVCAPTRIGLMMGKYQQRVGIYRPGGRRYTLPLEVKIFPQFFKEAGYKTGAIGKWHLGVTPSHNPTQRGFDEFYGFMQLGAHDYFRLDDPRAPLYRNMDVIEDTGYLTNRLTEEAIDFISRHRRDPFFMYLAYNAVHSPQQAPEKDIGQFDTGSRDRDILMAMLKHLDQGVGDVVATLKDLDIWKNTLIFFLTDNGGASGMQAMNTPLRGWKGSHYEGGVRTPFIVSWPARFKGGRKISRPVISLDILPTALDAAGINTDEISAGDAFDGHSLMPVLAGETGVMRDNLFWSEGGQTGKWAVRSGDWKLVVHQSHKELYHLQSDIGERNNVAVSYPEKVAALTELYDEWLDHMAEPSPPGVSKRWEP
ncbi:MAG: sulfatase-like hydrolase/transferase [Halioglobus sp.]|nr:sulfatase-like hydrolase/transferase [Halioglobus sp.]